MLSFLKAPANAPLITDKHEVDARYRYWRRHILITIWLGYALFYFTRKSFNAAAPEILASGILSRSDIGLFAYLGASLSGWPLAKVLEIWHWTGFFAVIAIAAGISALLLLPFLNAQAPRETSEA